MASLNGQTNTNHNDNDNDNNELMDVTHEKISTMIVKDMNTNQLKHYENYLYNEIKKIQKRRQEISTIYWNCKICKISPKNVVIIECGHFDLCVDCEKLQKEKRCFTCNKKYINNNDSDIGIQIVNH